MPLGDPSDDNWRDGLINLVTRIVFDSGWEPLGKLVIVAVVAALLYVVIKRFGVTRS